MHRDMNSLLQHPPVNQLAYVMTAKINPSSLFNWVKHTFWEHYAEIFMLQQTVKHSTCTLEFFICMHLNMGVLNLELWKVSRS